MMCDPQGIVLVEMGHSAMSNGSACGNRLRGNGSLMVQI